MFINKQSSELGKHGQFFLGNKGARLFIFCKQLIYRNMACCFFGTREHGQLKNLEKGTWPVSIWGHSKLV